MKSKTTLSNTLAIMSIYLIAQTAGIVGSTVQPMIEAFPDVPASTIRMVTTIPSMTGMIFTFLVGLVAGKKIGFKPICLIASICMLVGGVLPVFVTGSVYFVLICRLILGIGTGCFGIRNALVLKTFSAEQQANMIGKGYFCANLASIVLSSVVGILADISWNYGFGAYALAIITVIMVTLFLKEPEATPNTDTKQPEVKKEKVHYPKVIFVLGIFLALASIAGYCIILGISTFLVEENMGTASMAGTVISAFSLGGVIFNFFFGKLFALLKKYNLPAFALIMVLGLALVRWGGSAPMVYAGSFICGGSFAAFMSAIMAFAGQMVNSNVVTSATTVIMTINQLGILAASYYVTLAGLIFPGSEVAASFLFGMVTMIAIAVICIVGKIYPKSYDAK